MDLRNRFESLYRWGEVLGLTRQETYVVLVLALLSAAGALVRGMSPGPAPVVIERRILSGNDSAVSPIDTISENVWKAQADTLRRLVTHPAPKERLDTFFSALADAPVRTVNINRADTRELSGLAGIGPKLAERIIDFRQTHGEFRAVEDLQQVKGVGKKLIEKIKPFVDIH